MELPPSIELLLSECDPAKVTLESLRTKLRDDVFVKELRDQAEYTATKWEYPSSDPVSADTELVIHGSAGLSPLSLVGKCSSVGCREENALSFARSIGLYADYAVMTDYLSPKLYFLDSQNPVQATSVFGDLRALHVLRPLLRHGILKLGRGFQASCQMCQKALYKFSKRVAADAWERLVPTAEVVFWDGPKDQSTVSIGSDFFGDSTYYLQFSLPAHQARALKKKLEWRKGRKTPAESFAVLKRLMLPALDYQARTVLFEARASGRERATLATQSRFDAAALRSMDRSTVTQAFGEWELLHSCRLPWISELTAEEILRLRDQAQRALPKFRARIKKNLFSVPAKSISRDTHAARLAADLQNEVPDLEAELRAARVRTGKAIPVAVGTTGLAFVVYGLGSLNVPVAMAGATILSALATLHANHSTGRAEQERLAAKPAYVLLAARDLIKHRDG